VHPRLVETVARHLAADWRGPVHAGSRAAFEHFRRQHSTGRVLILDSGCGTGVSSLRLARRFPDAQVLGVDRSANRLGRAPAPLPDNLMLLRARVEDIWRLLIEHCIRPDRHFLLYPNPWPKARHLRRRWHGHPVFPMLLALGGVLELRCNWRAYAEEFRVAAAICGAPCVPVVSFGTESPLSPFERKYAASGHSLYRVRLSLEDDPCNV